MPRQRSPNRNKAKQIWLESNKKMLLKDIAVEIGVSESLVRKWKNQDQWDKVTLPNTKGNVTKPRGAPKGNKNALGNSGGAAPLRNKNAEKHGLFTKWLPPETLEIMQAIESKSPIDILWDQIMIQSTAIIRAQQIMYVHNQEDITKELTMQSNDASAWEVQQAWDKQANFLQAQSKAMTALNSMIKQYEEMLKSDLATEEQRMRIAKLKAETSRLTGDEQENAINDFIQATKPTSVAELYGVEEDDEN